MGVDEALLLGVDRDLSGGQLGANAKQDGKSQSKNDAQAIHEEKHTGSSVVGGLSCCLYA
jgi:hypothetical protein